MDLRWKCMCGLIWVLQKIGRGRGGKFVFAVAAKPEPGQGRLAVAVADTTAIPSGQSVRKLVDAIVAAHANGAMQCFLQHNGKPFEEMPQELKEAIEQLERREPLPARTWRTDEIGKA